MGIVEVFVQDVFGVGMVFVVVGVYVKLFVQLGYG